MSIDGISGGGGAGGIGTPKAPPKAASREFEVEATPQSETTDELARLESGELTIDEYVGARAAQATQHLQGYLSQEQLHTIRTELEEQMKTDPVLARLVQRATGVVQASVEAEG
jgi:hypothetical protein